MREIVFWLKIPCDRLVVKCILRSASSFRRLYFTNFTVCFISPVSHKERKDRLINPFQNTMSNSKSIYRCPVPIFIFYKRSKIKTHPYLNSPLWTLTSLHISIFALRPFPGISPWSISNGSGQVICLQWGFSRLTQILRFLSIETDDSFANN